MAFAQNVTLGPGSETLSSHTWEIALMLAGAFAFGFVLSHLLNNLKLRKLDQELELEQKHRSTVEHDFDQVRAEHSAFGSRVNTLEGELNGLRSQLADRLKERDEAKAGWQALLSETGALKSQFDAADRERSDLKASTERISAQLTDCGAKQGELRSEHARLHALLDESAGRRAALELQLSELQDEDRTNKHDVNLARVRTELSAALANRDALQAECERLRVQVQANSNAR